MRYLAKKEPCRHCGREIVLAVCRDGRWRVFEPELQPMPVPFAWAWRKHIGMEETDAVRGHLLHYCAEYSQFLADRKIKRAEEAS